MPTRTDVVRIALPVRLLWHLQDCFLGGKHGFMPDPKNCDLCAEIQEAINDVAREVRNADHL